VPLAKFPPKKRPDALSTIVTTLGMVLYIVVSPFSSPPAAPPVHLSPVPAPGSTVYGNDISWPQCAKSEGGNGLPGPLDTSSFAVLGLTDGGSFRANPCISSQVASVRSRHLWAGAYAISTYPTTAELARYGGSGTLTQQLRRVGSAQAAFNLATVARVGLQPPMIWVDVEPSTRTPWSARAEQNNAVVDGVIAGYRSAGIRSGIYSYAAAWKAITGARRMAGLPTWVTVGLGSKAKAAARCAATSYAGGKPWLTQWTDDVYDYDLACPGVTGRAAGTYTPPVRGFMGTLFAST
jgi:hypothetical protein